MNRRQSCISCHSLSYGRLYSPVHLPQSKKVITGSIICSRATWSEKGERNTKLFLNLENNKKKSYVRKILHTDGKETTNPNTIAKEYFPFMRIFMMKK